MNLSYSCTIIFVEKNKRFSFFPFFFRLVECLFEYIAYIHEPSSEIIFFQEKWKKAGRIVVSKYPTFHLQHHFQISFHSSLRPYLPRFSRVIKRSIHLIHIGREIPFLRATITLLKCSQLLPIHPSTYLKLIEIEINRRSKTI